MFLIRTICVASVCLTAACAPTPQPSLDLATTTSVRHSGLLDALMAAYSERRLRAHAAGSGRALEMLADGIVNAVISHAPDAEARYLAQHTDWSYRKFAFNHFVLVGPPADPARVSSTTDVVEAFRRIAASGSVFVSRGDGSGTHERETALWAAAETRPSPSKLLVSGRGMAVALRHADERQAYTLSDEATFWQFEAQLRLRILASGDARLLNTYAIVYPRDDDAAAAFAAWLIDGAGRHVVERLRVAGRPAFRLWPRGCPATHPEATLCRGPKPEA